jgi:hypothetical protein
MATLTINPVGQVDAATDYNCVLSSICPTMTSANASLVVFASSTGDGDASGATNGGDIKTFEQFLLIGGVPTPGYCACDSAGDAQVTTADVLGFVSNSN